MSIRSTKDVLPITKNILLITDSTCISGARSERINQIQISNHTFSIKTLDIKKHELQKVIRISFKLFPSLDNANRDNYNPTSRVRDKHNCNLLLRMCTMYNNKYSDMETTIMANKSKGGDKGTQMEC